MIETNSKLRTQKLLLAITLEIALVDEWFVFVR